MFFFRRFAFASTLVTLSLAAFANDKVALDAIAGRFTAVGVTYQSEGGRIDWSVNPTFNNFREWQFAFARHYFLSDLATYYRRTRDEKAAEAFVHIVGSFIGQAVPPPEGTKFNATDSWRTLDTGIRASNWVATYSAFTNSPAFTPEFSAKFRRSLKDHLVRLRPPMTLNNWRISELRGLADIVIEFPELDSDGTLLRQAEAELADILRNQVYPDGFHFELTPDYHSVLDRDYCPIADMYRKHGRKPPEFLKTGLESVFDMYVHIVAPDRRTPAVNDSGRLPVVSRMEKAAALYPHRTDFLWLATDGKEGKAPSYLSYAFPYAGAVVFRDSWSHDAVWGYVDMSPFGFGHQHEDKLNFLLFAYGKNMITEGGNYYYDTSEMRKYVLSTRAHNTVRIDGMDQYARKTWKWNDRMLHQKADMTFIASPEKDVATSSFGLGYGMGEVFDDSVVHVRTVEFVKNNGIPFFRITDELSAKDGKPHAYEQIWHLETCKLEMKDTSFVADFGEGVRLAAAFRSENGLLMDMRASKQPELQGWMPVCGPHKQREHRPIHTPTLKGTFSGKTTLVAVFRPVRYNYQQQTCKSKRR